MIHRKNISKARGLGVQAAEGYRLVDKAASYTKSEEEATKYNRIYANVVVVYSPPSAFYILVKNSSRRK